MAPATGVRATATHDTITVTWDPQPAAKYFSIGLRRAGGGVSQRFTPDGNQPHQVVFRHLPPETEYTVRVGIPAGEQSPVTEITASTAAAPTDWTPLPRGPQNLRTAVTHNSVTVSWDAPHAGAHDVYHVTLVPPAGLRQRVTVHSGVTAHTFTGLTPTTTYNVFVRHADIIGGRVETSVTTSAARAPRPLTLTLTASRAECTAGTLNPVSWTIRGGVGPYRLTVDGASVDADAESATVTCGDLPDYGIWLPVTQAPGTITAVVTDATGATATASAAYTIVPPLPAPANVSAQGLRTLAEARWDASPAASGSVHYILRWKKTADVDWTYEHEFLEYKHQGTKWLWSAEGLAEGTPYEVAVAVMRDPIERQTPDALRWSPRLSFATATDPQNVVVTSTHDTITVTWDVGAGDRLSQVWVDSGEGTKDPKTKTIANGQVRAVFTSLLPDTDYTVRIRTLQAPLPNQPTGATVSIRTKTAPSDWTPLPTGPKNLRVSATHNTITATWDAPHADANPSYGIDLKDVETGRPVPPWITIDETTFTLENLQPARSYELQVTHYGATTASETRTVTTGAAPTSALTCFEYLVGAVICTR